MNVFKEEQGFKQIWIQVILIITSVITVVLIANKWAAASDQNISAHVSSIFTLCSLLLVHVLFHFAKLTTRIDEKGIQYQFFPFHFSMRKIPWTEVSEIKIRNYNPIGEYGGWGLRYTFSKKRGNAVNVCGDIGIQIEFTNGKKLLIGTQKKEEAQRVLETYKSEI